MKLSQLIKNLPVKSVHGSKSVTITGLSTNSKRVTPGGLFIARKGLKSDGHAYIPDAVAAGAAAVVTDLYNPTLKVTQVITDFNLEGKLAARYYGQPSQKLFTVGITGTKGKTSTSYIVRHLLDQEKTGLIGTIEYIIGDHAYDASHTTPEVVANHRLFCEMLEQGCASAVMEVSSHALDQGRVDEIDFDVAVYTNLAPDHLDYHPTMEHYAASKSRLFDGRPAVVNVDCASWKEVVKKGIKITYGIDSEADLTAKDIELSITGSKFILCYRGEEFVCRLPLIGKHNIYNALAAASVALLRGKPLAQIANLLATCPPAPGRLEKIPNDRGLNVFVDFAHTGFALESALKSLLPFKKGKLILVFGAGGDRDPGRRRTLAEIASKYADMVIVTSDNPRTENPQSIIDEIVSFLTIPAETRVDRRIAIALAVESAVPHDVIVIAGRGHEKTQIFAHQTITFDDASVVKELTCANI